MFKRCDRHTKPKYTSLLIGVFLTLLLLLPCVGFSQEAVSEADAGSSVEQERTQPKPVLEEKREPHEGKPKSERLVTNMFYDTSIRDALSDIAAQTRVVIVPDLSVQGIVTCDLQDVPLEEALKIILSVGNFIFRDMGNYILVGSPNPESPSFFTLSETETLRLNYIKPSGAIKMLSEPMRKLVASNDETKTVSITAPRPILEQLMSNLKMFDHPPRQIMLDARIVVMETGDLLNMGVEWNWPQVLAGTFSNDELHGLGDNREGATWPWGIQIGYTTGEVFTNSLLLTLNLLGQNDDATVLANPQVMAQDGKEAEIKVTTEEYFEILTQGYYTQSKLEKIEAGTILKITPSIADNGDITLDMSAEVSDVVARGENKLPVVTRRKATSTVRVQNGGTAVVGGLIDNRTSQTESRVPGFGSLPVLGRLFRSDLNQQSSRQVAIFVTPRIIPEEESVVGGIIEDQIPVEPVGEEFREELLKALSRDYNGEEKK